MVAASDDKVLRNGESSAQNSVTDTITGNSKSIANNLTGSRKTRSRQQTTAVETAKEGNVAFDKVQQVVELTKCSSEDAAYVLSQNSYNVDQAVIAILDHPDVNMWKENKNKKKPKDKEVAAPRRSGPPAANRGRVAPGGRGPRDTRSGGPRFGNGPATKDIGGQIEKDKVKNDFPEVDSFSISTCTVQDDENWKKGPLVFEPSVPPESTDEPKKLSFAAVTAKGKKPAPTTVAPYQNYHSVSSADFSTTAAGSVAEVGETSSSTVSATVGALPAPVTSGTVEVGSQEPLVFSQPMQFVSEALVKDESSPASFAPLPTSSAAPSMNVNREFTDKLKNDIGIGLHHTSSESTTSSPRNRNATHGQTNFQQQASPILDFITNPALLSSKPTRGSFSQGVEFLTGNSPQAAVDFQFGFQQLDISAPQGSAMQQQPQTPPRATALSFTDPSSLEYQSHDSRQQTSLTDSIMSGGGKPNGTSHLSQQSLPPQQVAPSQQQQPTIQQQHALNLQQHSSMAQQVPQLHHHQPLQQQNSSSSLQQPAQHSAPSAQQQQPTPQQQQAAATQVPQSTQQHSLQQQQQQMYTAAAAQFPNYAFPYHLYSPVAANMREVDQYTAAALTPFPYMGQLDPLQLNAMLPPSLTATGGGGNAQSGGAGSAPSGGLNSGSGAGGNASSQPQNHHQLSQQTSQPSSVQQLQQHRGTAADNKYQSQLQSGGGNSANNGGLPTLAGSVPFQNLGSASQQQPGGHQNRNQSGGGLMNNSSSTGNSGVAPPPGFSAPHFVPQQSLQSLFHMPSYPTHTPMPFPMLFPGGPQQQQPSQQRQPQLPQNHHNQQQHMLQQQNHHQQQQQRHGGGGGLSMDHVSFMDMAKYPQANSGGNSNSNLQGLANAPFHGAGAAFGMNAGNQGQQQPLPLHRNQSLNQGNDW